MSDLMRKLISVVLVTSVTALGIYAFVGLEGDLLTRGVDAASAPGGSTALASQTSMGGSADVQTCPATGCTATSCHAKDPNAPGPGSGQSAAGGAGDPSGGSYSDPGAAQGDSAVQTCPATGCTATYCHATADSDDSGRRRGRHSDDTWGSS